MAVLPLIGALIDLGTNTFNLAVGQLEQGRLQLVHTQSEAVGLGRGGIQRGIITPEALERAQAALIKLTTLARQYGAVRLQAIGTSALRNASNANQLQAWCLQQLGLELLIVNGEREAQFIFSGVKHSGCLGKRPTLLLDIGGGSVEYIYANQQQPIWARSLEMGMARMHALFPLTDPPNTHLLAEVNAWIEGQLAPMEAQLRELAPCALLGSAGSFDTLLALAGTPLQQAKGHGLLRGLAFDAWHQRLWQMPRTEREQLPGMKPIRVDMMLYATALISRVKSLLQAEEVEVCGWSLREGALVELLAA
jgi:exopolyphosphatase/guanosine-5'-triphosphate,3'-diphosphate pyrophosphatase